MNINQLLNPVSASSTSRPQASARRLDPYLEHECGSSATADGSSLIHHSTTNHVGQDTRVSGSEALVAKRYVRNTELTSNVNEPTTQSYGVSPSRITHGRLPFLTTPPYPSDPRHFQYASTAASFRHDISAQLPIENISLNGRGSSYTGLTMALTRRGEFWPRQSFLLRYQPRCTKKDFSRNKPNSDECKSCSCYKIQRQPCRAKITVKCCIK